MGHTPEKNHNVGTWYRHEQCGCAGFYQCERSLSPIKRFEQTENLNARCCRNVPLQVACAIGCELLIDETVSQRPLVLIESALVGCSEGDCGEDGIPFGTIPLPLGDPWQAGIRGIQVANGRSDGEDECHIANGLGAMGGFTLFTKKGTFRSPLLYANPLEGVLD